MAGSDLQPGNSGADLQGVRFYKNEEEKQVDLEQGDVLARSSKLVDEIVRQYHQYYVERSINELFIVLTQSCDLLRRDGLPKARYIAIAPARPLRLVLQREFDTVLFDVPGGQHAIGTFTTRDRYGDFLKKLLNNNDPRFFYFPARPEFGISEDMCAILPLSISLKNEHYEHFIGARIAQLHDVFQAKLGWLIGQQYSRVGTPDWPGEFVDQKVAGVATRSLTWVPDHSYDQWRSLITDFKNQHPDAAVTEDHLLDFRTKIKSKRDLAVDAIIEVVAHLGLIPAGKSEERFKLRKQLNNDAALAKFLPKQ